MKKVVFILLLLPSLSFSQMHIEINGGWGHGGMLVGGGLDYEIDKIVQVSLGYREYNITGEDYRELITSVGYKFGNKVNIVPKIGLLYRWDNEKLNRDLVENLALKCSFRVTNDARIFVEGLYNREVNVVIGIRHRLVFSKNKRHRFF